MAYVYPEMPAQNPEATDPVPALSYDYWAVTRVNYVLQNVVADGGLEVAGSMQIFGQLYNRTEGVINPVGDLTTAYLENIVEYLDANPVLAAAHDQFVQACALMLDLATAQAGAIAASEEEFEEWLHKLHTAAISLGNEDFASKVATCIRAYPVVWTKEQCLVYLGLMDPNTLPPDAEFQPVDPEDVP
jgi:hypothetical protein